MSLLVFHLYFPCFNLWIWEHFPHFYTCRFLADESRVELKINLCKDLSFKITEIISIIKACPL